MLQRLTSLLFKKENGTKCHYLNPIGQCLNLSRRYLGVMEPNTKLHYLSKPQGAPADGALRVEAVPVLR